MAHKYLDISNISKAVALALVTSSLSIFPIGQAVKAAGTTNPNDGTCDLVAAAANSYSISSTAELQEVPDCVGAGNNTFTLETDISLAGVNFPLNDSASPIAFSGILDGGGYAITDISISSSVTQSMGLFTSVNNAEFRNLELTGRVATSSTVIRQLGSLAGLASGFITVSNVVSSVEASIPSSNSAVAAGGIFGRVLTVQGGGLNLSNVLLMGNVTSAKVGGIAGEVTSTTGIASIVVSSVSNLSSLISSFTTPGQGFQAGGLFGNMTQVEVALKGVLNAATVSGQAGTGGLIGQITGTQLEIQDATNSGVVKGLLTGTGGLVGKASLQISASRVANLGAVSGTTSTGGLFGEGGNASGTVLIKAAINAASVVGSFLYTGGIIGLVWSTSEIVQASNSGPISSSSVLVGGLVGQALGALVIDKSGNAGSVIGKEGGVGGLVGESFLSAEIYNSSNSGDVTSTGKFNDAFSGGVIGLSKTAKLSKVINSGAVKAITRFSGGLIGQILRPAQVSISEALNTGAIQAKSEAGGIVGGSGGSATTTMTIENSANYGQVVATTGTASGVIGSATAIDVLKISSSLQVGAVSATSSPTDSIVISPISVTYSATYTNVDSIHVSKQADTTLQQASSYAGWNFTQIWGFPSCSTNNGFPVLRFANPGVALSDQSCADFDTPQQNTSGSSNPTEPTSTPTEPTKYSGPELQSLLTPVRPGSSAVFQGYKLNLVYEVVISGSPVASFSTSVTSLEIVVPANLAPGTYDVEVRSEYGRLTALSALTVAEPLVTPVTSSPAPNSKLLRWVWTAKFQGNSVGLTKQQINLIRATKVPAGSKTAICWSYTNAFDTNPAAVARATSRAKAVCQLVSKANPKLKLMIRVRAAEDNTQISRTAVQFWK